MNRQTMKYNSSINNISWGGGQFDAVNADRTDCLTDILMPPVTPDRCLSPDFSRMRSKHCFLVCVTCFQLWF